MSTQPLFDLASTDARWSAAAETTVELLEQNDLLMEQRIELRKKRLELLSELVNAARGFVDSAAAVSSPERQVRWPSSDR